MMTRRRLSVITAVALIAILATGAGWLAHATYFGTKTITAYFTTATGIYPGDQVRVVGVKVGTISAIQAEGTRTKLTLHIDPDLAVPADAKAIIIAPNLVAARYVQLAPAYTATGPIIADGAVIPVSRTATPVEWDEVKKQLTRLATDLGPDSQISGTAIGRFIESAADALKGNGDKLRQTLTQLSAAGRIVADGGGNIADIIKNLQAFVTALRDSNEQIVQFQDRLATVTAVVDDSRSDLDSALTTLSTAITDIKRFIEGSRNQTAEQIQRLANVTGNLADHRTELENLLHGAPNTIANAYNIYNPDTGADVGSFAFQNFANPVEFLCAGIGAVENTTAPETAKLCAQYLGPALRLLNFNYLPIPVNPYLQPAPSNLVYSDPSLAPGGGGPRPGPAEAPPAVSAYTGANGDVPPPPGWNNPPRPPGSYAPNGLPADTSPALYPGAPLPGPPSVLPGAALPAERPTP
ncbi:MCE family protein [Mycobacterium sp. EPa45]|uniref:MCE family protein n=1 Tax=Mycobacterium sp. EPa45 TaxID=1545728 RepID=UPI000641F4E0|nr:MCE family protein [Mycobacterium sp. EPa45]AKK29534.1 mammalian cell entry protein [Mycobacterium sp. EPa45]